MNPLQIVQLVAMIVQIIRDNPELFDAIRAFLQRLIQMPSDERKEVIMITASLISDEVDPSSSAQA